MGNIFHLYHLWHLLNYFLTIIANFLKALTILTFSNFQLKILGFSVPRFTWIAEDSGKNSVLLVFTIQMRHNNISTSTLNFFRQEEMFHTLVGLISKISRQKHSV